MLWAKGAHDDLLIAAYRAQADTLKIECRTARFCGTVHPSKTAGGEYV